MFAYKTTTGSAPLYLNSLLQTYVPSRSLRSASLSKSLSQTFKWNVPSWWNDLPNSIWAAESLAIFKNRLKHISSIFIWPSKAPFTLRWSQKIAGVPSVWTQTRPGINSGIDPGLGT